MSRPAVGGRGAVVRQALGNDRPRRVLAAYLLFNVAEWATWIASLLGRLPRGASARRGICRQTLSYLAVAMALVVDAQLVMVRLTAMPQPSRSR